MIAAAAGPGEATPGAPSAAGLALRGVGKDFGRHRALADVSLQFSPGRIAVILGPNGAGKTTLLGILATLTAPSAGRVWLDGREVRRGDAGRAAVGYVGHDPGVYLDLPARDNLLLFAALHGVAHAADRANALLARVGLGGVSAGAPARTFSRGMQQRLALARALLHEPRILLFDEPGATLDPAGAAWLRGALLRERDAGRVIVLVTHDLEAAAGLADHVIILRRGRVVHDDEHAGRPDAAALTARFKEATRG